MIDRVDDIQITALVAVVLRHAAGRPRPGLRRVRRSRRSGGGGLIDRRTPHIQHQLRIHVGGPIEVILGVGLTFQLCYLIYAQEGFWEHIQWLNEDGVHNTLARTLYSGCSTHHEKGRWDLGVGP